MANPADRSRAKIWLWLLILPLIALVWVPSYNKVEPQLLGFPFFYWYQLVWVIIGALIMALVYVKTRHCWTSDKQEGQQ